MCKQAKPTWYLSNRITRKRNGFVLLIVLITIVVLSLSAYTFTQLMQTEEQAARLMSRRVQSKFLMESGVDYTRLFMSYSDADRFEKGGIWDNEIVFRGFPVAQDQTKNEVFGRFTIISSSLNSETGAPEGFRYGLMDESSKININTLPYADDWVPGGGRSLLMSLPYMTEDIADAIIDWVDSDEDLREYGAESSYYTGMTPPYQCKNGPMDSLEELLLVRGVTPQLMFGLDTNRNGIIDNNELLDGDATSMDDDMLLGWSNYLTLYSKESNLNSDGLTRINLNSPDLERLYDDLRSAFDENWSRFIINYRLNGPYTPREDDEISSTAANYEIDFSKEPQFTFNQLLDLVDAHTTAYDPDDLNDIAIIKSPIQMLNLGFTMPIAMQNLTTFDGEIIPGRVNIMQAPRRVLEGIPGMTPDILEDIIYKREFELDDPTGVDQNRKFETWLLVERVVDLPTMRMMFPFICAGGDVYRAEIVGYFDDGVATTRAELILDTTTDIPRILSLRDKSHLDSGYTIDTLGIDIIR